MVFLSGTAEDPDIGATRARWLVALSSLAAAFAVLLAPFHHEVAGAVRVWTESTAYNHCFLVIPIVVYLVWHRRASLRGLVPCPSIWGLGIVAAASAGWLLAALLDILELRQFLLLAMVQGLLLGVLGQQIYGRLAAPFLYLFFLVPSGEILVPSLQDFTARFAVAGLRLLGVPVYSDGVMIDIPEGSFVVAEACAGLRFLIASIAYGTLYAVLLYRSPWRRLAFIGLSLIVPVIANGLRAFGIIYAAHLFDATAAIEADHIVYGWLFFSLVIVALSLVGMTFSEGWQTVRTAAAHGRTRTGSALGPTIAAAVAVSVALAGPTYALAIDGTSAGRGLAALDVPDPGPPWREVRSSGWHPVVINADREVLNAFTDGKDQIERFVALYAIGATADNVLRSENRIADEKTWRRVETGVATIRLGERKYSVRIDRVVANERSRFVWSFYVIDGRVVGSRLLAKMYQAYARLAGRGRIGAFVALSADTTDSADPPDLALDRFMNSSPALREFIQRL